MILLKTAVTAAEFRQLNPVLVDKNREIIVDTIYGTGLETYDSCRFMHYDDFMQYRTERIKLHHWYNYDTMYYFAKDHYPVKYNYCRFKYNGNNDLFLRFNDPVTKVYGYIAIPVNCRIHLHDFGDGIRKRRPLAEITSMHALVMEVSRSEWKLPDK